MEREEEEEIESRRRNEFLGGIYRGKEKGFCVVISGFSANFSVDGKSWGHFACLAFMEKLPRGKYLKKHEVQLTALCLKHG